MIIANQRCCAKNLPKQTQQYSVHLDQQVEHRQEVAVSTAVADERRRSKCSTREWPSNSPHFFFFLTKPSRVVVFNTDIEQQGRLTSTECTIISLYLLLPSFFFLVDSPLPPQRGEGTASGALSMSKLSTARIL